MALTDVSRYGPVAASNRPRIEEHRSENLPLELTNFVGREAEMSEVGGLLHDHRLLTLVGPGGCGKTRLARAVVPRAAGSLGSDAWWVKLASLSDPELVLQTVTRAVGLHEVPGRPLLGLLIEHLGRGGALLALDNCEHLIESCATLVAILLEGCPDLRILTTSREPLGVPGEVSWLVPPLSLDPERDEAVRLFSERARAVSSGFDLTDENIAAVRRICERLDGMPLAIELAAARIGVLSPRQILRRLDDRFLLLTGGGRTAAPRNRTLRATVDWSYDLLSEQERILFRRLSVFVGGFSLETAEEVCPGGGLGREAVLDLLSELARKSLLVVYPGGAGGDNRYGMLETIRAYALEKLEASDERAMFGSRHAAYFLDLAEEAEPELLGPEQAGWMDRLAVEHDNFRAALLWLGESGEVDLALRLGGSLWRYWWFWGHFSEGRARLSALLELPAARTRTARRAKALHVLGVLACRRAEYSDASGEFAEAARYQEEAISIYRDLGDRRGVAAALNELARARSMATADLSTWRKTIPLVDEALLIYRELGDDAHGLAISLMYMGVREQMLGNATAARSFFGQSVELFKELGDVMHVLISTWLLARSKIDEGDHEAARSHLREVLEVMSPSRSRWFYPRVLEGVAHLAAATGEAERALRMAGAAAALRSSLGAEEAPPFRAYVEQRLERSRRELGDRASTRAIGEGLGLTLEGAISEAMLVLRPVTEEGHASGRTAGSLLTTREVEVLRLVADGLTDAQVAEKLHLSARTVSGHLGSVYGKLEASSRTAAVMKAARRGLI